MRGKGTQVDDTRPVPPVREHCYFVYLLASRRNGTLYLGVTNDVMRRTWEHKSDVIDGFTKKYGVHTLVWFETYDDINVAIAREKQIKGWNRAWKIKLIEGQNSGWNDLYERLLGEIALPDMPGFPSLAAPDGAARRE
jgi:putative endonuclease